MVIGWIAVGELWRYSSWRFQGTGWSWVQNVSQPMVQVPLAHYIAKGSMKVESAWVGNLLNMRAKKDRRLRGCHVAMLRSICSDMTLWFFVMNKFCHTYLSTWSSNHLILVFYLEQLDYVGLLPFDIGPFGLRSGVPKTLFQWSRAALKPTIRCSCWCFSSA